MISDRLVGKDNDLFRKSKVSIKNIPIGGDDQPLEKATFSTLQLSDFSLPWNQSEWKRFFEETTFIYIAYFGLRNGMKLENGNRILEKLYKFRFTNEDLMDFGKTYNMIKRAIDENDVSFLPTASSDVSNKYKLVIAPKSSAGGVYDRFLDDTRETCFMLNKDFLQKKFKTAITLG
ncbi:hypothetical protein [Exiguobacterium sp. s102]|uniref:hypothetical protein n=1 Tax=Exiguobacterium sp. s102 TaxID=2751212 RepID=UPI001BE909B3|nr:hypothetical protein [Exiguobacterium sp. s102]